MRVPKPLAIRPAISWSFCDEAAALPRHGVRAPPAAREGSRPPSASAPAAAARTTAGRRLPRLRRRCRQVLQQLAAGLLLSGVAAAQLEAERVLVVDADRPAARRPGQGQRQPVWADVQDRHAARAVVDLDGAPGPASRS